MGTPQIIWIGLATLGAGICLAKHGQPHDGKHNFGTSGVATALQVGLLYWGGFFG